jgi:pSer/pThr/pTyr-binding forkhead associated (FHA) protein
LRLLVSAQGDPRGRLFRYDFDPHRAQILLGRRGGVDVLLPHAAVSSVHARIERRGDSYQLVDDRSTNGTYLNGARLEPGEKRPLAEGDKIGIGEFIVEVAAVEADDPPTGESSISIARRMVSEVLGVLGPGGEHPSLTVVQGASTGARLMIAEEGRRYLVGRAPSCDLAIDDAQVAPEHLRIKRDYRGVTACDLESPTGLYVNDQFAAGERALRDGDRLTLGKAVLRFEDPAEVYLKKLEQVPTPEEARPRGGAERRAPPARPRGELAVVGIALAVAAVAAAGLVYLWVS